MEPAINDDLIFTIFLTPPPSVTYFSTPRKGLP